MGRYCIVCQRERPNERFGGKGRKAVVCKTCRKSGRQQVDHALDALWLDGLPHQKQISPKNVARLHELAIGDDTELARQAIDCLALAAIGTCKKARRRNLRATAPSIYHAAIEQGWISAPCEEPPEEDDMHLGPPPPTEPPTEPPADWSDDDGLPF